VAAKANIFDVARLAGVSRGTVDRILHHRGIVSEATRIKVEKAIEELGYKPDENASRLATKKIYHIVSLTPEPGEDDYWKRIDDGFDEGEEIVSRFYNVELKRLHFDQTDKDSFDKAAKEILKEQPDGVILTDVFQFATRNLAAELHSKKIPYAFLDTKDDALPYTTFVGVNAEKSGALGAHLLCLADNNPKEVAIITVNRDPSLMADPNGKRRDGFLRHMGERFPDCKFHQILIDPVSADRNSEIMDEFTASHPKVKNFVVICSRLYLLARWFASHSDPERTVIGFEDLDANMVALREGLATFLVTRHIPYQSRDILVEFTKILSGNSVPKDRNNYVHMDILCKMNIDDYNRG